MKNILHIAFLAFILTSCFKGQKVDLIIHNGEINTLNEKNEVQDAIAIKDGKIVEVGPERQILNKYTAKEEIDAGSRSIYPSLSDFNVQLFEGARKQLALDLYKTASEDEMLVRLEKYDQKFQHDFVIAYNLDTSLWDTKHRLSDERINLLFPKKAVYLIFENQKHILLNNSARKKQNINTSSPIVEFSEIELPNFKEVLVKEELNSILHSFLQYGVTEIHASKLSKDQIKIINQIETEINITPSLNFDATNSFNFQTKAALLYLDLKNFPIKKNYQTFINNCIENNKQVFFNVTDSITLEKAIYFCELANEQKKDHRWIIHYCKNLNKENLERISLTGAFLSLSPSSAIKNKEYYHYNKTIESLGLYLISSEYPLNKLYPYEVIQNATTPNNNFSMSVNEIMKGYCYWSSFAHFKEGTSGTIEKGKDATLVIFEKPLKQNFDLKSNYAKYVFKKGKIIYKID